MNVTLANILANSVTLTLSDHDNECILCGNNQPPVLNEYITVDEINDVLDKLLNNKSPGIDGLLYEIYKVATNILTQPLMIT